MPNTAHSQSCFAIGCADECAYRRLPDNETLRHGKS